MEDEANMFTELGQCGFYVNAFGNRQNIILVEDKEKKLIFSKDSIPLQCKVYIGVKDVDSFYIGTVEGCKMIEKSVGNIHEVSLYDVPNVSDVPVYKPNTFATHMKEKIENLDEDKIGIPIEEAQKKVLCAKCNKPIHVDDLGAINKDGIYHKNIDCIMDLDIDFSVVSTNEELEFDENKQVLNNVIDDLIGN